MLERIAAFRLMLQKPAEARSMKEKLTIAAGLKAAEQGLQVFTRLAATLILTRLLAPEIYGVFVVIITLQVMVTMITDFGPRSLILSMREDEGLDDRFLHTCWTLQVIRGGILLVLFLAIAAGIAGAQTAGMVSPESAYAAEDLPAAFAVLGLVPVIQGFETMKQYLHERELRLVRLTLIRLAFVVLAPTLMILFALITPTVWCMIFASIAAQAFRTAALTLALDGPKMRLLIDRRHWREILSHLRWIMSTSGLWAFGREADSFILGFFLTSPFLGTYFIAKQIVSLPLNFALDFMASTGVQVFTRLLAYGDLEALRRDYYRFRLPLDAVAFFLAGGFMVAGPAIVALLYDPRFADAGPIVQILAIGLPTIGFIMINSGFAAQRRFRIVTVTTLLDVTVLLTGLMVALVVFGSPWGAFFAIALLRVPSALLLLWLGGREGWVSLRREFLMTPMLLLGAAAGWLGAEVVTLLGFQ
ncbi:MAG: oligosaccharide flippase family protein [Pseudomonadota bacterium]